MSEAEQRSSAEAFAKLYGTAQSGMYGMGMGSSMPSGSPLQGGGMMMMGMGYPMTPEAPVAGGAPARSSEDLALDYQIDMSRVLKSIPSSVFSDRFKSAALANPTNLYAIVNPKDISYDRFNMPWPANDPAAPVKSVEAKDFAQALTGITADQKKTLSELIDRDPRYAESRRLKRLAEARLENAPIVTNANSSTRPSAKPTAKPEARKRSAQVATGGYGTLQPSDKIFSESEIKEFGDRAKSYLIQSISRGAPEAKWSVGQRAMIERVRAFQVARLGGGSSGYSINEGRMELSLVRGADHSLEMGKLLYQMTGTLSDCALESPQYRVSSVVFANLPTSLYPNDADKRTAENCLKNATYVTESCLGNGSAKLKELLLNTGVIQPAIEPIKPSDLPLQTIRDCIVDQTGAQTVSERDLDRFVDHVSRIRKSELGSSYNAREDKKKIREAYASRPACYQLGKTDQTSTALRTWLTSQAVGLYVKEAPSEERAVRAGGFLFNSMSIGYGSFESSADQITTPTQLIERAKQDFDLNRSSNTVSNTKLYRSLVLGQPELRDALGCRDAGEKPVCQNQSRLPESPTAGRSVR